MPMNPKSVTPDGNEANPPLWRQQFPIDTVDDTSRSRREFIGGVTVAGGAMACGQTALNYVAPDPAELTDTVDIPPLTLSKKLGDIAVGETILFHFPNQKSPCLLVKLSDQEFVAFAQKCTHLACPVIPNFEENEFHCPCHHGSFDIRTGNPLLGPPRSPLRKVRVEASSDGTLKATGFLRLEAARGS